MATTKKRLWEGGDWLFDKGATVYSLIGSSVLAAAMTYLASLAKQLPPVAWGAIGVVTFLAVMIGITLARYLLAKQKEAEARQGELEARREFTQSFSQRADINPLKREHERVRIRMTDMYHPFFERYENYRFTYCEIVGPVNILLNGHSHISYCQFVECEWIIIHDDAVMVSPVAFLNAHFENCKFFRTTFFMDEASARSLQLDGGTLNIISGPKIS